MPLTSGPLRSLLLCAGVLCVGHAGAAQDSNATAALPGWRGYTFGMTMAQARRVPGATLSRRPQKGAQDFDDMLFFHTRENGRPVQVGLRFLPVSGLRSINLQFSGDYPNLWSNLSAADCEKKFQGILTDAEARYGAFDSRLLEKPQGTQSMEALPGGRSRYLKIVNDKGVGFGLRQGFATRTFGPRAVGVHMVLMQLGKAGATCQIGLGLSDPT